jgi:hypothetical protein
MPGGIIFEYKCRAQHKSTRIHPPRTPYDKHTQIICRECLASDKTEWAYLIFACPESSGSKPDVGSKQQP